MSHTGVITTWSREKRQGFVRIEGTTTDVWIYYASAPLGIRYRVGMKIEFALIATPRGYQAADVKVVGESKARIETKEERLHREGMAETGYTPVAWGRSDGEMPKSTEWHLEDPLFPGQTVCGLSIPKERLIEGGPYPKECPRCRGRAQRAIRERESRDDGRRRGKGRSRG